jgi:hypothetical protein
MRHRRSEDPSILYISSNIATSEQTEDGDVENEDYDPGHTQPVRWVREVVKQNGGNARPHVDGEEGGRKVETSVRET